MKATELITQLAAQIAREGDCEVFLPSTQPDQFRKVLNGGVRVAKVQKENGNQLGYLTAAKASALGYDASGILRGIVIG